MKQLKYILPLLLTIITIAIYNPIETQANINQYNIQFIDNSIINVNGSITSRNDFMRTNIIPIQNNTVIISNSSLANNLIFLTDDSGDADSSILGKDIGNIELFLSSEEFNKFKDKFLVKQFLKIIQKHI
jgi:hypothetical protein